MNINIFRENDFIILEIEDNGVGRKKVPTVKDKKTQINGYCHYQEKNRDTTYKNELRIIDLVDNTGNAMGTKVSIKLYAPE